MRLLRFEVVFGKAWPADGFTNTNADEGVVPSHRTACEPQWSMVYHVADWCLFRALGLRCSREAH
jgi:hypothetical protein